MWLYQTTLAWIPDSRQVAWISVTHQTKRHSGFVNVYLWAFAHHYAINSLAGNGVKHVFFISLAGISGKTGVKE
jgi:hypothetical protein